MNSSVPDENLEQDHGLSRKSMVVVLNLGAGYFSGAGGRQRRSHLVQLFETCCPNSRLVWAPPDDMGKEILKAAESSSEILIVGGGDGTINRTVNALAGTEKPIGVLPLGTFNLIARDLHIPLDVETAVKTLTAGRIEEIDVGEINGYIFVHNISLGIHRKAVEMREVYRKKMNIGKIAAVAFAAFKAALQPPLMSGYLESVDDAEFIRAPFVFVGVNRFETDIFSLMQRLSLTDGNLSVLYSPQVKPPARLFMFKLGLYAIFKRRFKEVPELKSILTQEFTIHSRKKRLKALADGEFVRFRTPLNFRIRPRYLRMMIPKLEE